MSTELSDWLSAHGLAELATLFSDHDIDLDVIRDLEERDLTELGLSMGQRKRLLRAIPLLPPTSLESQAQVPGQPQASPSLAESESAERRQLTVMFCDLVGSTELSERYDPEDMRDLLATYRQTCVSVIDRFGGFVARYIGDGILVYFGYPRAHEYQVERAARAGLDIVGAFEGPADSVVGSEQLPLNVRVGIATGTVVVGDIVSEGTKEHHAVVGQTPNLAARLMTLAEPGSVVIEEATEHLLQDLFELTDLGKHELRGFAQPVHAWRIVGESAIKTPSHALYSRAHLTPLIAREDEVERLSRRWEEARAGRGQVVLISGEAGIGKSRLVRHFRDLIDQDNQSYALVRAYCSSSHQSSALFPIISQILYDARIDVSDSNDAKLEKIEKYLSKNGAYSDSAIRLVCDLLAVDGGERYPPLDLSPDAHKSKTFEFLEQRICDQALKQPVLLILEDLHWCDPTTLELLDRLILDRVQSLPILILLTFRTEFRSPWPDEHYITDIRVKRLSPTDCETFVSELAFHRRLPSDVMAEIIVKSDRIPLFIEEVYKATTDDLTLSDEGDRYVSRYSAASIIVPSSLSDSLMARLDRLGSVKQIAQVASVIGRDITYELIEDVSQTNSNSLHSLLDQLVIAEILRQRPVGPVTTYEFKHALLQDAAYSSLLTRERTKLHARIAKVLERKHPQRVEREPELLAHHCAKGGLAERAVDYWHKAGEHARETSANSEAIDHVSQGLELLKTLPDSPENAQREMDLRTCLALALTALHGAGADEVGANYSRARVLSQTGGDISKNFAVLVGCWLNSFIRAELYEAQVLSSELEELATRKEDAAYLVEANRVRGMTMLYSGDFSASRAYTESALAQHDPEQHRLHAVRYGLDPRICCESYLAYALWFLGYPEEAVQRSREAVAAAEALGHPYTHAFSLAFAAFLHQHLELKEQTRELAVRAIEISEENEFQFWDRQQTILRLWSDAERCRTDAGMAELREALDLYLGRGSVLESTRFLSLLAEVYVNNGRVDESLTMLERATNMANKTGEQFYLAEIHRLRAVACLAQGGDGAVDDACKNFRSSLDTAEDQNAASWQLKTAKSVATSCLALGEQEDRASGLLEMCGRFDGGLDLTDVTPAARDLLDTLTQ